MQKANMKYRNCFTNGKINFAKRKKNTTGDTERTEVRDDIKY